MKTILALLLIAFLSVAHAFKSPLIEQFKADGIVEMHGACEYKGELFLCIVVKSQGKQWIVIGDAGPEHLEEKYILEINGNEAKEVWAHNWVEV